MSRASVGLMLLIAGSINIFLIGWVASSRIEVEEWRAHNNNLVFILEKLTKIEDAILRNAKEK